jgi:hypoxanthine phosphoribosyltransferase
MKNVQIEDKFFEEFIPGEEIEVFVSEMANKIDSHYENKNVLLLGILNGSFMIVSDLVKEMTIDPEISFIKVASYEGTSSTGQVKSLIGLQGDLNGRDVLIVEDIVDTGNTLKHIVDLLSERGAKSVKIATLFYKPEAYSHTIPLDFVGKEIPDRFVIGYGMDYNGRGRNLSSLYQLCP